MRYLRILVLLAAVTLVFPSAVFSQEAEAPADSVAVEEKPTDPEQARAHLATLNAELDSLTSLREKIKYADEEKFKLYRVSALRHTEVIDDIQPKLMDLLSKLSAEDPETESIRKGTADFLIAKYDIFEHTTEWWAREIDTQRDRRSDTPYEELAEVEARIAEARGKLDGLLLYLEKIIKDAESLGVDTTETWENFDRAINNRAETLVSRLQVAVDMRNDLNKMITARRRSGVADTDISEEMTRLQYAEARVKGVAKSLDATAGLLGSRGFQTASYRQFIIQSTGEISEKILDPRVLFGILKDALESVGHWLADNGPTILFRTLMVIGIVVLFRLIFRLIWWLLRLTHLIKLTRLMVQLGDSILNPVATMVGLFAGLWVIGANPTTLLTGAGVAGVIIGFALQDSMANLAAGFFILATRPFDVDDVIRTGTVVGTVKAMWIANTTVVTFDGRRLLIPNRIIWGDIIENRSVEPLRRADIVVRVGFEEDLDRAISILHELVKEEGRVLDHPEPSVFTLAWAESWVEIAVRPWARNADWWPLLQDLPRLVVKRFAEEGIEIPYPRRELAGMKDSRDSDSEKGADE